VKVRAVCFDLGGVLVRICSTWSEAIAEAGVEGRAPDGQRFHEVEAFVQYQSGRIDEDRYLASLAGSLGCVTFDDARASHNHILRGPYPDTAKVAETLARQGLLTGCLSNTNAMHWAEMTRTDRFPAVAALPVKVASHIERVSKPDIAAFQRFGAAASAEPDEILLFDDTAVNIAAARTAGWQAVLIDPNGNPAGQMRSSLQTFGLL
jgi:glucose-1-phosphatase